MITVSSGCCAAVILGMIGVKTVASVILVAMFSGSSLVHVSPFILRLWMRMLTKRQTLL